ncbi:MAG TPA: hypothetical protein VG848_14950 [Acetobacteraceae bacterium]|jgi:hypothetical protein|nr:hypothetical protein [Acetobacteraceae bacterium]
MPRTAWLAALLIFAAILGGIHPARAESPDAYCRQAGTDDTLREIPAQLVPISTRLFGLSAMPPSEVRRSTYYRCMSGHVFVCNLGANLPCGKADTSRDLSGADEWCAQNQNSDFIPMYVTGHDTIYRWRCAGPKAVIIGTVFRVDPRGFVAEMWKQADP